MFGKIQHNVSGVGRNLELCSGRLVAQLEIIENERDYIWRM